MIMEGCYLSMILIGRFSRESRYLLILTENYAALPIIQRELLSEEDDAVVIFGSSFPKDQEYTQVKWHIKLLTNVKDKDKPHDRQETVYRIHCIPLYIGETGKNVDTRLTEHKRAFRKGDITNRISEHHR